MTPGRPLTFVVTQDFLDHFGLESARDLPGLKELREAGLLESRAPDAEDGDGPDPQGDDDTGDMFDDDPEAAPEDEDDY
jgi:segregation and condensation protein B